MIQMSMTRNESEWVSIKKKGGPCRPSAVLSNLNYFDMLSILSIFSALSIFTLMSHAAHHRSLAACAFCLSSPILYGAWASSPKARAGCEKAACPDTWRGL